MSGIPVDDPDFLYLGVDKKKVLQEAPAYDGKKNCWVTDVKHGYLAAEIESTKGDVVTVMTEKREVRHVHAGVCVDVHRCINIPCSCSI